MPFSLLPEFKPFVVTFDPAAPRRDYAGVSMVVRLSEPDPRRFLAWDRFTPEDIAEIREAGGDEAAEAAEALNEMFDPTPTSPT